TVAGHYGSLTVNEDGTYSYVPDAAAINALSAGDYADIFTVQTRDVHGATGTATFTVNVTGANDTPTLSAVTAGPLVDTAAVDSFSDITGTLVGADADTGETATLKYAVLDSASHAVTTVAGHYGSLTVNEDGTYSYVPDAAAINALSAGDYADIFAVQTRDVHGATGTATFTVNVTGANDTPKLSAVTTVPLVDTAAVDSFSDITGTLVGADADTGETATLKYAVLDPACHAVTTVAGHYGSLTVNDDGTYSYVPDAAAINALAAGDYTDIFTVQTKDALGATGTATFTVNVTGANDAPVITAETNDSAGISVSETNTGLVKAGTLTLSDADTADHVSVALDHVNVYLDDQLYTDNVGGLSNADLLSDFTVPSGYILNGTATQAQFNWGFNSHGQAFDFLAAGQTLTLQYTIVPSDGHAATGTGNGVVTITIVGSNDAPTLDNTTLAFVAGDNTDPSGSAISALFTDKFHDVDTGANFKAIAVTSDAATADQGVWQYELAGTSQWVDIGSVSDAQALVLSPDTLIRFLPADGFTGTPTSLGVHALDDTYAGDITSASGAATTDITDGKGGTTPISDALTTISTDVTAPENGPAANGPVINTEFFHVETNHESIPETDTIVGLVVDDTDPGVAEHGFTVQISTAHPDLSDVDFYPASGSLADVNSGFDMGVTYNPTGATTSPSGVSPDPDAVPPETDQITLIVTDTTTGLHDTVNFIFVESGSFQGNHLYGTDGKDVIFAADNGDELTGGAGKDQFVFMPRGSGNDGQHTITDFTEGLDKIDLRQFSDVASMDDLTICQESGGTLVKWTQQIAQPNGPPVTEHESLLLQNMTATLQPTDFIFGTHIA
ncbi:VCBS domain-containing protein, partial [Bradyrhizobium diazoefficiens]